ncbi:MAG: fibrillarin-like rRNA/tRNA 2'-O-methyltransferase [Candidatus Micrarchaeota archaeon]|nr:fibrillarin-like rRNA/tRNA 2'-O-methyltransferase [Candidatus Micrarchaeota archaeon]
MEEKFPGVYFVDGRLATRSFAPKTKVYGEKTVEVEGAEYRFWDPYRSKLSSAILSGLKELPIKPGSNVLYLGAASGTTASHVSDIVGESGSVYCVEFAHRPMRDLIGVCEKRSNMFPLLADARKPEAYAKSIGTPDCIYQDVAQPDQAEILYSNARFALPAGGHALLAIKSQSIDMSIPPSQVYENVIRKLEGSFEILEKIDISRFEKDHLFIHMRRKTFSGARGI